MYDSYFEPFERSEAELKEHIVFAVKDLAQNWPQHFSCDVNRIPEANSDTPYFIVEIIGLNSSVKQAEPVILASDSMCALRIIFRLISAIRWSCEIELRLLAFISHIFSPQLLGFRYLAATELIASELHEELKYDREFIMDYLSNPMGQSNKAMGVQCSIAAEMEIARISENPATQQRFEAGIARFEESVEAQIKEALPSVLFEISTRLIIEATGRSSIIIDSEFGSGEGVGAKEISEIVKATASIGQRHLHERLGIKRGGRRSTTKFVWTDERKCAFYDKVCELVHSDGQPLWQYAYDELVSKDFSYRIIDYLRNETALKNAPGDLWNDAMKSWKGQASSFTRLAAEKSHDAFAMYHAMSLLNFPTTRFSTMKKYFGQGKTLSQANTNS